MRFDLIFESIIKRTIREGGNAIANVDRIEKKLIAKTVSAFKRKILVPFFGGEDPGERMFLLGSTGKKPSSGDIDIGIDARGLKERSKIVNLIKLNEICARKGINSCINTVNYNMLHVAFPQAGANKLVQVDVLLTDTPEFTKFYMFSPAPNESRYKGAHRNCLLNAILYEATLEPILVGEDGEPLRWTQLTMKDDGLFKEVKTLVDENGDRLLYKDTKEELELQYAKTEESVKITDNAEYAVKITLGDSYTIDDASSFEKLFSIVKDDEDFRYRYKSDAILATAKRVIQEAKKRLVMPDELKKLH